MVCKNSAWDYEEAKCKRYGAIKELKCVGFAGGEATNE